MLFQRQLLLASSECGLIRVVSGLWIRGGMERSGEEKLILSIGFVEGWSGVEGRNIYCSIGFVGGWSGEEMKRSGGERYLLLFCCRHILFESRIL